MVLVKRARLIRKSERNTAWPDKRPTTFTQRSHSITIDMHNVAVVSGLTYRPLRSGGRMSDYAIHLSQDGKGWGRAVATGTLANDPTVKTLSFAPTGTRFVRVTATAGAGISAEELNLLGDPGTEPASVVDLPRVGWTVTTSGQSTDTDTHLSQHVLRNERSQSDRWPGHLAQQRRSITIDMHHTTVVSGISYQPHLSSANGQVSQYVVSTSTDGTAFGHPVAVGSWEAGSSVKGATFTRPVLARYVRLTATNASNHRTPFPMAADIRLSGPANPAMHGAWGPLKGFPLVPVATATLPNNKLLAWSSYAPDRYTRGHGYTQTAVMDLATGKISHRRVDNTQHDMFCPGIAMLADGRVLVTGGETPERASIYDPTTDRWMSTSNMNIARGYQAMTLLSGGDAFVLGGSWSGNQTTQKNGEVWSAASGTWRRLTGVPVSGMMTADPKGPYRADNHLWLHATSQGKILQLGPSKQINWISTTGKGFVSPAGTRADSNDAMNGNAVAYDIGKLLTVGGATAYEHAPATRRAYTVDLNHGGQPRSARTGDMTHARAFCNSVVMPDGKVAVFGGQSTPMPFSDAGSVMTPEVWDPATGRFTPMASMAVPRNYHSVANLLPDGRIFTGGGGLCGDCATNHPNGAIFTPPYLLNPDGTAKRRPRITRTLPAKAQNGTKLQISADGSIISFALIRAGAATHSGNNDQRRIPLSYRQKGTNSYELKIPSDPGVALPGSYMLFALDKHGVPSKAAMINIGSAGAQPRQARH
ncbi:discoidin domain-containing protein [Streptomyces noursei]|uniref:discoidin domain-containing protein n=1 Tax=Streptomyces noursei TaxID=1971 RepID=UPI0022C94DA8|nr:discoidin domain-containing protein [Streptomyces noursei]